MRTATGELSRLGLLVLLIGVAAFVSPGFLQADNGRVVLLAVSTVGMMSIGMTLVLLAGDIDLSVGGTAVLATVVGGLLIPTGSPFLTVAATLATGIGVGIVNGVCVALLRVPSLIVTLATLGIARAVGNIVAGGQAIYPNDMPAYLWFGRGSLLGVPVPILLFAAAAAFGIILARFSTFGRMLYATGGNLAAAAYSGIPTTTVRLTVFALSGFFAALAGIMESARLSYINPAGFAGVELTVIAVTILGGASLTGGRGTIEGTLIAALIVGVINNTLNLLGISIYVQQIVTAAVILLIVLPDSFRKGSRA
jgi:ribose/xylose/arabinose/galactoside ABC-type transport system permease subunit